MGVSAKNQGNKEVEDVGIPLVSTLVEFGVSKTMGWPLGAVSFSVEGKKANPPKDRYLLTIAETIRVVLKKKGTDKGQAGYQWIKAVRCEGVRLSEGEPQPMCLVVVGDGQGSERALRKRHEEFQKKLSEAIRAADKGHVSEFDNLNPMQTAVYNAIRKYRKENDCREISFYLPKQASKRESIKLSQCETLTIHLDEKPPQKRKTGTLSGSVKVGAVNESGTKVHFRPEKYDRPDLPVAGVVAPIKSEGDRALLLFAKSVGVALEADVGFVQNGSRNDGRVRSINFASLEGISQEVARDDQGNLYVKTTMPQPVELPTESANDK